jgi:metallophosphoesterase superfamily enzyme
VRRKEFISFVEDHLHKYGVEIIEHIDVHCPCGHDFGEETLRKRIARGDKDIACPLCESRHSLLEGAAKARERDPKIQQHTWALKYRVEEARKTVTRQAVQTLASANEAQALARPIRLLHLSDLHFNKETSVASRLQWLLDDVKLDTGLGFKELDYLVVSGDFTDKACNDGFEKAFEFLSGLIAQFALSAERCILVPGNHDVANPEDAYARRKDSAGLLDDEWFKEGRIILARDPAKYPLRFKPFSDNFYHKFLQQPYPFAPAEQGVAIPFWDTRIQFITLNSCWEIDEFYRQRAGVHPEAVANAMAQAQQQEADARKSGQLAKDKPVLRIAVWHHAVTAPDYKMKDIEFLSNLQKNAVKLALHGDVHEMRRDIIGHWHPSQLHIIGSGSFGARATDRPEATPCLYNVLEIARDLKSMKVHTRRQLTATGAWEGWHEWPDPNNPNARLPYYEVELGSP